MNSKLLRSELKNIVKECLVEILAEGLESSSSRNYQSEKPRRQKINEQKAGQRMTHLDNIHYGKSQENTSSNKLKTELTENPIINEILADTAQSTLSEQMQAESRRGSGAVALQGDAAAKAVNNSSPEELFGGVSDKWATLAFSWKN